MSKISIPLVDLPANYQTIQKQVDRAVDSVIRSGMYIQGGQVISFEEKFADYCNTKYCIGVASGTDALHLCLLALGIKKGDEVILPANTFIASLYAVLYAGGVPILVDVDENTACLNIAALEKKITSKTKVIMPVHLYGKPADMNNIKRIARRYRLKVLEDACQAHGAWYYGKKVGSLGDMAAFSFYPGKNLGAYGDAGAITTNSISLMKKIKLLREYGANKKYYFETVGFNSRLDALQAAILEVKLKHLNSWNKKRQQAAKYYQQRLNQDLPFIKIFKEDPKALSVYHLFVIVVPQRDQLQKYLATKGINTGIHYPVPIHLQKSVRFLGYQTGAFPVSENLAKSILSLPLYPEITRDQQDFIINTIKEYYF